MKKFRSRYPGVLIISYYTGYIILGTALLMAIPLLTSLVLLE
jgi:trk system potassium uptake protein TrkH